MLRSSCSPSRHPLLPNPVVPPVPYPVHLAPRSAFWSGCSFRTFKLDAPNFLAINVTVNDCYYVETANSSCLWQDFGGLVDMQLEGLLGPDGERDLRP